MKNNEKKLCKILYRICSWKIIILTIYCGCGILMEVLTGNHLSKKNGGVYYETVGCY